MWMLPIIAFAIPGLAQSLSCNRGTRQYVRKDIMEFSGPELRCWHKSMQQLITDGTYYELNHLHATFGLTGHQDYKFCPSHSELIRQFECQLVAAAQSLGCPLPGAPYFNMEKRSKAWAQGRNELFTERYLGECRPSQCLTGKFSTIRVRNPISELQLREDPNCVWRTCEFGALFSEMGMSAVLHDAMNLRDMGSGVFVANHLQGHKQLGGYMGICRESAYDPFFWLLHANVARLCQYWQKDMSPLHMSARQMLEPADLSLLFHPLGMDFGQLYARDEAENVRYIEVGTTAGVQPYDLYLFDENLGIMTKKEVEELHDVDDFLEKNHLPEDAKTKIKDTIEHNEESMVKENAVESSGDAIGNVVFAGMIVMVSWWICLALW